jgi:DNA primase
MECRADGYAKGPRPPGIGISREPRKDLVAVYTIFDTLREEVPLNRVLDTSGSGPKVSCIAHDEQTPSMHLYDEHVHCFGCGFHGDVVDVWGQLQGLRGSPIEAALDLAREFSVKLCQR